MADDAALIVQALVLALAVDDDVDLVEELPEGELLVFQRHAAGLDAAHVEDVVDEAEHVLGAGADLFELLARLRLEVGVAQRDVVEADDRVHGRPDLMAHVGQEAGLGAAGFLRRHELRLELLVFQDALRDPVQHQVHDENEDAAAEEDAGHDEIRLPEEPDDQIAQQEHDQQGDRDVQDAGARLEGRLAPDAARKADEAVDVADHQRSAEEYHAVNQI